MIRDNYGAKKRERELQIIIAIDNRKFREREREKKTNKKVGVWSRICFFFEMN